MKPFVPENVTLEEAKQLRDKLLEFVAESVCLIGVDRRDSWPAKPNEYIKGDTLARGDFGIVKAADCQDSTFGFTGNESRRCVVKTVYFRKRLESILAEKVFHRTNSSLPADEKLYRFLRRTFMEVYILTRCRHENIMHSHAIFFADCDLHIVLPRFYVLHDLIKLYRERYNADPMPIAVIARILRQLCLALQFLRKIGIMHRDLQPDNIFVTRNGTVKLGHFGQSRAVLPSSTEPPVTPVGKEEFMAFEKLHNLTARSKSECLSYSYSADIWSLGVLVLQMTTYFPDEQFHKLPKNFPILMHDDHMPFGWLTTNMMQLRSRLVKSGGEELKAFLSDKLLTVDPTTRPGASDLLNTKEMRKWCSPKIEDDKKFLRKKLIDDLDFANQFKLEAEGYNYDFLESKDIPAEFYWDDSWKRLDDQHFSITVEVSQAPVVTTEFRWGDPSPLFSILQPLIERDLIELSDLVIIEPEVDSLAFALIEKCKNGKNRSLSKETTVSLPSSIHETTRKVKVTLKITSIKRRDSFGWSTDSESESAVGPDSN